MKFLFSKSVLISSILLALALVLVIYNVDKKAERQRLAEENQWLWNHLKLRVLNEQGLVGPNDQEYGFTPEIRRKLRGKSIHYYAFILYISRHSDLAWVTSSGEGAEFRSLADLNKYQDVVSDPLGLVDSDGFDPELAPEFIPGAVYRDRATYENYVEQYIHWYKGNDKHLVE